MDSKYITLLFLFIALLTSCSKEIPITTVCGVDNPIEELDWLTMEVNNIDESLREYFYISKAQYNDQTVFIFGNCCPFCNTVVPVRNCSGELLGVLGSGDQDIDPKLVSQQDIIWKPVNFSCIE